MGDAYDAMDAGRVPTKAEVERELARVGAELERERRDSADLHATWKATEAELERERTQNAALRTWVEEAASALRAATTINERMLRTGRVESLHLSNQERLVREAEIWNPFRSGGSLYTGAREFGRKRHEVRQLDMGTTNAPLRRIIEETYDALGLDMDRLECGHLVYAPTDRNGDRVSANRRRCRYCLVAQQYAALSTQEESKA